MDMQQLPESQERPDYVKASGFEQYNTTFACADDIGIPPPEHAALLEYPEKAIRLADDNEGNARWTSWNSIDAFLRCRTLTYFPIHPASRNWQEFKANWVTPAELNRRRLATEAAQQREQAGPPMAFNTTQPTTRELPASSTAPTRKGSRCQRCADRKQKCDGQRPCAECLRSSAGAAGCVDEKKKPKRGGAGKRRRRSEDDDDYQDDNDPKEPFIPPMGYFLQDGSRSEHSQSSSTQGQSTTTTGQQNTKLSDDNSTDQGNRRDSTRSQMQQAIWDRRRREAGLPPRCLCCWKMRKGCDGGQSCGRCAKSGIGADGCILETQVQDAATVGASQHTDDAVDDGEEDEAQGDVDEPPGQLQRSSSTEAAQDNEEEDKRSHVDPIQPQADQELEEADSSWPFPIPGQNTQRPFDLSVLHEDNENEYPGDGGIDSCLQMDGSSFEQIESEGLGGMDELNSSFLPRAVVDGAEDLEQAKQVNENCYQTVAGAVDRRWEGRLRM